jgi:alpha-L-arabinofuranosidase
MKELNIPVVRWPGGNVASGYNWEDGIGPKAQRPARQELAWHSIETNQMGTDEYVKFCKLIGAENLFVSMPEQELLTMQDTGLNIATSLKERIILI